MVIHEENTPPVESHANVTANECVLANNHVREQFAVNSMEYLVIKNKSDWAEEKKKRKTAENRIIPAQTLNSDSEENVEVAHISKDDLEELRSVYKKCKSVMNKIESKYGHLLNLEEPPLKKRKKLPDSEESDTNKCECSVNKKILFDDDGREIAAESELENHICVKKLKRTRSTDQVKVNNVQVEYDTPEISLPDDTGSLTAILRNSKLETIYRNKVIHKLKMVKQEYSDEVRFNKQLLIEKIKTNADEMLDFKGTNLMSLPGYPIS